MLDLSTWDAVTSGASMNWERSGWRTALQNERDLGVLSRSGHVPWQPGGQPASWGASGTV